MKNFKKFIKEAHLGNPLNEEDRATTVDKMLSGEYEDEDYKDSKRYDDVRAELDEEISDELKAKYDDAAMDEYGKPFAELDIAQKQELMRAIIKWTGKEFETDFERRRRGDYSDDREDGMTDYQRRRMDEELKLGVKYELPTGETGYIMTGGSKDPKDWKFSGNKESYLSVKDKLKPTEKQPGKYDGVDFMDENMNDPVLMKTRAAQMKRDAMDKKDLENKSKRISADEAIDLRYELSILNKEREDILMRIEDLGVEMEQTSEPEGGPIADKLGERLMAADKELRAVNNKIIDIKDDLGVFDMNESINENTLGDLVKKYGKDLINFVIDIDELTKEEIKDIEYLDDRIQIHLEEPEIRQRYLPEGTCGYGEDGVIGDKPAGPDLNEDEIPSYLTSNKAFEKAVGDSVSYNDFEKRVYGILGPKYFKLAKIENPGAMKDYYDSIVSMEEAIDLDIDDAHSGDAALDRAVGKMGYNESLQETLRKNLKKRLS